MASKRLENKLDILFAKYIRQRDSKNGVFLCCSCGKTKPVEQMDAGHFISRRKKKTRWHEDNVFGQCHFCNRFDQGGAAGYGIFMVKKFGLEYVESLHQLAQTTAKYTDADIEQMIADYKDKLKALEHG